MTEDKRNIMFEEAKFLAQQHQEDKLSYDDRQLFYHFGQTAASFVLGARWADKEGSWINITDRMPEDSLPEVSNPKRSRDYIKVLIRLKNDTIMEGRRRLSYNRTYYWNIPIRMRDQITHWMPIPPLPSEIVYENKQK